MKEYREEIEKKKEKLHIHERRRRKSCIYMCMDMYGSQKICTALTLSLGTSGKLRMRSPKVIFGASLKLMAAKFRARQAVSQLATRRSTVTVAPYPQIRSIP